MHRRTLVVEVVAVDVDIRLWTHSRGDVVEVVKVVTIALMVVVLVIEVGDGLIVVINDVMRDSAQAKSEVHMRQCIHSVSVGCTQDQKATYLQHQQTLSIRKEQIHLDRCVGDRRMGDV